MKNAERVTGTKKMFREKRFLQKKRLLAVLLLTVLSICLVGGMWKQACIDTGCGYPVFLYRILAL